MAVSPAPSDEREVIGSVDGDGASREYVIADITEDDAWLTIDVEDAITLAAWR
jgi:hypothetical protein